jgi:hypothetical protein
MKAIIRITILLLVVVAPACHHDIATNPPCGVGDDLNTLRGIQQLNDVITRDPFISLNDPWDERIVTWQNAAQRIADKTGPQNCPGVHEQAKVLSVKLEGLEDSNKKLRRQIAYPGLPKEEERLHRRAVEASP